MSEMLLDIRDLRVTYATDSGDLPAVRGVSLHVRRGEIVGVAGESGCGKSTLASTVLRLSPKTAAVEGSVLVSGRDVLTLSWGELRAVRWAEASIIFQGALHSLNPVQRIGKQLAEPIIVHQPDVPAAELEGRVAELLQHVGLPASRAQAYPHQLSGGQRQRVMIALALACGPDLIIADEPTTALDVMVQAQVLEVLAGLVRDHNVGLMIISHDLSVLAHLCDRIAVMYAGQVVEEGPGAEVFTSPGHPYAAALAAAFPSIGDPAARYAPTGLAGDPPDPRDLAGGCAFAPRCDRAEPACSTWTPTLLEVSPGRRTACRVVAGVDA